MLKFQTQKLNHAEPNKQWQVNCGIKYMLQKSHEEKNSSANNNYTKKVWIAGGIIAFITIILLLISAVFSVLLLVLAGALIAIYFRGLSALICRKTKWKNAVCLTISIAGTLLFIASLFWLIGAKTSEQISELSDTLPAAVEKAKADLNQTKIGKKIIATASSHQSAERLKKTASRFFQSTFGMLGDIYVVLFIGIFFTASPKTYTKGIVQLVPDKGKARAQDVLNNIGDNLKKWLKGKIFAMFVVFILTAISLAVLGMPMWLALALIAGILNFIPNFGPLIAMIPAVLVALTQNATEALIIAGLYTLIQIIESNFITPMVQQKLIKIPPALIIIAQLLIAPFSGGWGLVLATPLMVIIIVLIKQLYLKQNIKE